jgi:hypothetical protein
LRLVGILREKDNKSAFAQLHSGSGFGMSEESHIAVRVVGRGAIELIDIPYQHLLLT